MVQILQIMILTDNSLTNSFSNSTQGLTMKKLLFPLVLVVLLLSPYVSFGFEGKCVEGDCVNGRGTMKYSDGSRYEGNWKNGVFNGQGTLTLTDHWKYEGEWKDGERDGRGTMIEIDGGKYVGEWKEGVRHGKGVEKNFFGDETEGFWFYGMYAGTEKPKD